MKIIKISFFYKIGLLFFIISSSSYSYSQKIEIIVNQVQNDVLSNYKTYHVFAKLPSKDCSLLSIFGDQNHNLEIKTTSNFFQHHYGGNLSTDIDEALLSLSPKLNFDSWITIGHAQDLTTTNIDFSNFEDGKSLIIENGSLHLKSHGVKKVSYDKPPFLLMQLSTNGDINGSLNIEYLTEDGDTLRVYDLRFSTTNYKEQTSLNKTRSLEEIRIRSSNQEANISVIAVIGKESILCNGSNDNGQALAELVEGELLGVYDIVERKHLQEILKEQRLSMSGLIIEDSAFAQAGLLAGAQGSVLASYGCLQGKTKIQIKLVDCSTSNLIWSATGVDVSEFDLMDALRIELSK